MDHLQQAARIRSAVVRLGRRMRQERNEGGLSANQLGVLGQLRRVGSATPGEIAAAERQRPQSLTRVFAELEALGLIERRPDTADRRQSVLTLTGPGHRALRQDMAERDAWLAGALATLGETEREVLRLAAALMDRLADAEPDGTESDPDGTESERDGTGSDPDGTESERDGTGSDPDGTDSERDGTAG